jgi:two-component system response regulator AtoC
VRISPEAIDLLKSQPWPGNVRQLQNFVERLVLLSDGDTLGARDVQREIDRQSVIGAPAPAPLPGTLEGHRRSAEKEALLAALAKCENNRSRAARLLGISRRTLYHKLEEYGIM